MTYLILQAAGAAYLTFTGFALQTHNYLSLVLLKLAPATIGILLSFFTVADFMGWPV